MSLAPSASEDAVFVSQVATNIRTVLALRQLHAGQAAAHIGMSPQTFSQRMAGTSRWLAAEIRRLARVLDVSPAVLLAVDEAEFKQELSRSRCIPVPAGEGQYELLTRDLATAWNASPVLEAV